MKWVVAGGSIAALLGVAFVTMIGAVSTGGGLCSVGVCSNGVFGARLFLGLGAVVTLAMLGVAAWAWRRGWPLPAVLTLPALYLQTAAWVGHFHDVALLARCCPPD